jgi:hypothetical protein
LENVITDGDIIAALRAACEKAGSQKQWAKDNDLSPSYVSDVLKYYRPITARLAGKLGYKPVKGWAKDGE